MTKDEQAYVIARNYTFATRAGGCFEIGDCEEPDEEWIRLAYGDNVTRVLLKYKPDELPPPK